jgi:hypothetical protein
MLFVMPVVFIIAFGAMFSSDGTKGRPRPIGIWYAADNARGAAIDRTLEKSPGFVPKHFPSADAVRAAVKSEDTIAGLIVPESGPVELSIDLGKEQQVIGPVQGALTGVVMRAMSPVPVENLPPMIEAKSPPGVAKPIEDF